MVQCSPKLSERYLTSNEQAYQIDPPGLAPGAYWLQSLPDKQLPQLITEASIPALFGDDLNGFIDHVQQMLTIDPEFRPTASMATQHAWLQAQLAARLRPTGDVPTPAA
jgi:serine/threonine protein kinase